ncbi:DEAD box protein/DEAH protein box helicase [Aphelenchoides avenae]|nr:DEAD box protein/DEAH protein box helicase [Aphelenchus avenae]
MNEVPEAVSNSEKPTPFLKDYSRYDPAENDDDDFTRDGWVTEFMPTTLVDIPELKLRGASITPMMDWLELGLTDKMRKLIGEVCAMSTSPSASYLAPLLLDGHDVKACVRVAPEDYLIPLTTKLIEDSVRYEETYDEEQNQVMPYAVVICADESRCLDVYGTARQLASRNHLKTRKSSGDESERQFQRGMQRLMKHCHLLCTTVMRANLLFNTLAGAVSAKKVRYLILDDMHKLTEDDMEYHREVLITLLQSFPPRDNRQTLFLSASGGSLVDYLARTSLKESFAELIHVSNRD